MSATKFHMDSATDSIRSYTEEDPMAQIAKQLNHQMDYVNELLEQIHRLESQHLQFQKSANEKQNQLKQALHLADAAKVEAQNTKVQLAVAQDVSSRLGEEAKQAKVENGALRRQVDGLEKVLSEVKVEIAQLREAKEDLSHTVERLQSENKRLHTELSEFQIDHNERIEALTATNATLSKELTDLRREVNPKDAEMDLLRGQITRLKEEVEASRNAKNAANQKFEKANSLLAQTEAALRDAQLANGRLSRSLEEDLITQNQIQERLNAQSALLQMRDAEILALSTRVRELTDELGNSRGESEQLQREAETIAAELLTVAHAKEAERGSHEERLAEALENLQLIAKEAREKENLHALELSRKQEEITALRLSHEKALAVAAENASRLEELLNESHKRNDQLRAEKSRAIVDRDQAVAALEARINAISASESARSSEVSEREAYLTQRLEEYTESQRERDAAHVALLTALQGALRQLHSEHSVALEALAAADARARAHAQRCEQVLEQQQQPLDAWYEEAGKTFILLVDRVKQAKARVAAVEERVHLSELSAEEARSELIMKREEISRLDYEWKRARVRAEEAEGNYASLQRSSATELRTALQANSDLEGQLKRANEKLENSNKQKIQLQERVLELSNELEKEKEVSHARLKILDSGAMASEATVKNLQEELDNVRGRLQLLEEQLAEERTNAENFKHAAAESAAEAQRSQQTAAATLGHYQQQVASLTEALGGMEKQHSRTQTLLALMQEQRRSLEEANSQMRAELDSIYAASLGAMSASMNE